MSLENVIVVELLCVLALICLAWWWGAYSIREILGLDRPHPAGEPSSWSGDRRAKEGNGNTGFGLVRRLPWPYKPHPAGELPSRPGDEARHGKSPGLDWEPGGTEHAARLPVPPQRHHR